MLEITEQIRERRWATRNVPREFPEERQALEEGADELEWRDRKFNEFRAQILAIASQKYTADERERDDWRRRRNSSETPTFADLERLKYLDLDKTAPDPAQMLEALFYIGDLDQRLDTWCRELVQAKLATWEEIRKINPVIPSSPGRQAKLHKENREHERLAEALDKILKSPADPWDRRMLLEIYNRLDEPLSEGKLNATIQGGIAAGLLGFEWRAGAKFGGWLHRFLHGQELNNGEFLR